MKYRRITFIPISPIAPLILCLALQTAQAQQPEDNLERHQNFRGEMLTTLVDQENWYRDIRSGSWEDSGLEPDRLIEILTMVAEQSDDTEIFDQDHEAWIQVWMSVAKDAEEKATNTSNQTKTKALYTEAYMAHMLASYPHNNAEITLREIEAAAQSYVKAGNVYRAGRVGRINLEVEGVNTTALLHLPEGGGPFPVVMWSGGIDVTMVEHQHHFEKYFEPEGVAFIAFDIPAVGLNQKIPFVPSKAAVVHHAVYTAIKNHSLLDENKVAALSTSGGGVSIVRFAIENQNIKAAVSRCGLVDGPLGNTAIFPMLPQMTLDSWATRIGANPMDFDDVAAKSTPYSLVVSGLLDGSILTNVPLLAINTHQDPIAPPKDMLATAKASATGQVAFFGASGHCPNEPAASEFIANFILSRITKE
jgi:esterase FrsA